MPARRKPLPQELTIGAFRASQAAAAGIEPGALRGPGVQRIGRGLFLAASCDPTYQTLVAAYLTVLPAGVTAVDGVSALRLWGVEVGTERPYRYVTTAKHHSVRGEVRVRRTSQGLPPCQHQVLLPLPALVAARHDLDLVSLVVAGDWLIRARHATLSEVQAALAAARDGIVGGPDAPPNLFVRGVSRRVKPGSGCSWSWQGCLSPSAMSNSAMSVDSSHGSTSTCEHGGWLGNMRVISTAPIPIPMERICGGTSASSRSACCRSGSPRRI